MPMFQPALLTRMSRLAERRHDSLHRRADGGRVGLVELDHGGPAASGRDLANRLDGARLVADPRHCHVGAGLGQRDGDGAPDITGAAGDERDATPQLHACLLHAGELQLLRAVTADEVVTRDLLPGRRLGPAHVDRVRAARVEVAAARRCGGSDLALQEDAPLRAVRHGHRGEQRLGVRVHRALKRCSVSASSTMLPDVHHRDAVADVLDHTQVVSDEDIGQAELRLQVLQQIQDLRRTETSTAEQLVATTSRGRSASARAMPMRWRSPPLKAWG